MCFGIKESFQVREKFGCRARSEVRESLWGRGGGVMVQAKLRSQAEFYGPWNF
jgi:hypothetical protein